MGFRSDLWMDLLEANILHYCGLDRHENVNVILIQSNGGELNGIETVLFFLFSASDRD